MTATKKQIEAKLRHAMTTMTNDDFSEIGSENRKRFVARIDAMLNAADYLAALSLSPPADRGTA